jgi:hypothetical protein
MKIKDLKKNKSKSVRINGEVLAIIEAQGLTLQSWLDLQLEKQIDIKIIKCDSTKEEK